MRARPEADLRFTHMEVLRRVSWSLVGPGGERSRRRTEAP